MARRPEFDRDEVIRKAMAVFWAEGYQAASVNRLSEAMGLRPGSIYAAFENKDRLFREALSTYVGDIRRRASAPLPPRTILEKWFELFIEAAVEGHRGCLLLNTATESSHMDPEAAAAVRAELDNLERFFAATVRKARTQRKTPSALATARLLIGALAGISALSRARVDRDMLRDIGQAALAAI